MTTKPHPTGAMLDALIKYATENPGTYIVTGWDGDSVLRAFADSNPEPQERASCCNHASDCAVHNEPAYPAGPCDCGAEPQDMDNPGERVYQNAGELFDALGISSDPQAQAGEPHAEISLRELRKSIKTGEKWRVADGYVMSIKDHNEAIAKKDAALNACVEAAAKMQQARDAEIRAEASYKNAVENFSDHRMGEKCTSGRYKQRRRQKLNSAPPSPKHRRR